jgi:predicted aminopeptidase
MPSSARFCLSVVLLVATALLSGCANLGYYAQSIGGQMQIFHRQKPIGELLDDRRTPTPLKEKLATVLHIREFASNELSLPENGTYRDYADIGRPHVVWNVFAAPAVSLELKRWCFAFVGCVAYRGYFSPDRAQALAQELRDQSYDVYVGAVPIYSTLGWFADPVLNTVIDEPEVELAGLIFHELAHQVVYVRGDSVFNESFATAVELEGAHRWLAQRGSSEQWAAYAAAKDRHWQFLRLVAGYRARFAQLYASDASVNDKLARKRALFNELLAEYEELRTRWGGFAGYDRFFARDLNNAHLAALATYYELVPAFQALLTQHEGDLRAFYRSVRKIGMLPKAERHARLAALSGAARAGD